MVRFLSIVYLNKILTGFVNKILDLVVAPGRHSPPPNVFTILNKKYTRFKDEMILKMKTEYNS